MNPLPQALPAPSATRFPAWLLCLMLVLLRVAAKAALTPFNPLNNHVTFLAWTAEQVRGHLYWTFGKSTGHARALFRFPLVSCAGFLLSAAITDACTAVFGAPFWVAIAALVSVVPPVTWMAGRYWSFR